MARYSAGARAAGAGSTTLPSASLYAAAATSPVLVEVAAFNTTTTAVSLKLVLLTTAGTQGSGLTETKHDPNSAAAACTGFNTHTVGPTIVDLGIQLLLGAAVGAGVIRTFRGISVPVGTGNGIGLVVANGTGQIIDVDFTWDE